MQAVVLCASMFFLASADACNSKALDDIVENFSNGPTLDDYMGNAKEFWVEHQNFCVSQKNEDLPTKAYSFGENIEDCKSHCEKDNECSAVEWYEQGWNGDKCFLVYGRFTNPAKQGFNGKQWRDATCHVKIGIRCTAVKEPGCACARNYHCPMSAKWCQDWVGNGKIGYGTCQNHTVCKADCRGCQLGNKCYKTEMRMTELDCRRAGGMYCKEICPKDSSDGYCKRGGYCDQGKCKI